MKLLRALAGLLMLILILAGCGSQQGGGEGTHTYPTDPGAIVLQGFRWGGFAPLFSSTIVPRWSLYGDGKLFFQKGTAPQDQFFYKQLSTSEIQKILAVVIDEKQIFASTQDHYDNPQVADVPDWTLQMNADEHHLVVGMSSIPDPSHTQAQRLSDIAQYMETYVQNITDAQPYISSNIAVQVGQGDPPDSTTYQAQPWPYPEISLARLAERNKSDNDYQIRELVSFSQTALAKVTALPRTNPYFSQDGQTYYVFYWPLLPDALHPPSGQQPVYTTAEGYKIRGIPLVKFAELS